MDLLRQLQTLSLQEGGSPGAWPAPLVRDDWRPSDFMQGAVIVDGQGFRNHLERSPPSKSPGVDSDVTYPSEQLLVGSKPTVLSDTAGTVIYVGGNDGTVRIRDARNFIHTTHHLQLRYSGPVNNMIFPLVVGQTVEKGTPIGKLGNVGTTKDHRHDSIYDEKNKVFVDPQNTWRSKDGSVESIKDYQRHLFDVLRQRGVQLFDRIDPAAANRAGGSC